MLFRSACAAITSLPILSRYSSCHALANGSIFSKSAIKICASWVILAKERCVALFAALMAVAAASIFAASTLSFSNAIFSSCLSNIAFQMAADLSAASLFSTEKEDIILSKEASTAANPGAAFLSALAFLLPMGRPLEAAAGVAGPSPPRPSLVRVRRMSSHFLQP